MSDLVEKIKEINKCPHCKERVREYEPGHGGTVTDKNEARWHWDCYKKAKNL